MRGKTGKRSFEEWLKTSLAEDPALAARVERRLAEMRIEQDLVALRETRGLTQAQLGKMLGISQPAVARMEAEGGNLELRTLVRAADALGARLEIRLVSARQSTPAHRLGGERGLGRKYADDPVHPGLVHDSKARYRVAHAGRVAPRRNAGRALASKKR